MSPRTREQLKVAGVVVGAMALTIAGWAAMAYVVVWTARCALE